MVVGLSRWIAAKIVCFLKTCTILFTDLLALGFKRWIINVMAGDLLIEASLVTTASLSVMRRSNVWH
jgi:hypothetical protein